MQNSAARLRSSRDAQARLLAERRSGARANGDEEMAESSPDAVGAVDVVVKDSGEGEGAGAEPAASMSSGVPTGAEGRAGKEKLVVVFRLPLSVEQAIIGIPGATEVGSTYVLRALAKEARAVLRRLASPDDLRPFTADATAIRKLPARQRTVGESMTVYVRSSVVEAMHPSLGDPWKIEPRATIVGAYLAAIALRLIETRRAG